MYNVIRSKIPPYDIESYLYNNVYIRNDPTSQEYKRLFALIDAGTIVEEVLEKGFEELRSEAIASSMGGSDALSVLNYMYKNGYRAWRDQLTRIYNLYPNPAGDDTTDDRYPY